MIYLYVNLVQRFMQQLVISRQKSEHGITLLHKTVCLLAKLLQSCPTLCDP